MTESAAFATVPFFAILQWVSGKPKKSYILLGFYIHSAIMMMLEEIFLWRMCIMQETAKKHLSMDAFKDFVSKIEITPLVVEISYSPWAKPTRAEFTSVINRVSQRPFTFSHQPKNSAYIAFFVEMDLGSELKELASYRREDDKIIIYWGDFSRIPSN
ncbi:MAG: hypothetical protein OEL53_08945 [Rhodospirillales bacterium]|nr:hypothetical protein [Rhodospirillales bacterium]